MSLTESPASVARKQEIQQKIAEIVKQQKEEFKRRVEANKQYAKLMTEKILKEYKKEHTELEERLSNTSEMYVPAEPNFFVAIQIRSQIKISPRPRKTLALLRLKNINNCVILKNNQSIKNMLQNAKDYIAFGTISYELLRRLIYTRGYGKINGTKVKLTNENIETAFQGKFKCIEELCDVIYHGKEDMKDVLRFLCPFKLGPPKGGFKNGHKKRSFVQGGSTNDHKELLGELLERMIQ
ncbi:60S ribosomal protein L7 [Vittaforma corneae ATCC 50505]|uniref:60S ribosomal protein L7 n=1 Tax=Vittaforma corneae (strain ATCC 50505) TaxID=993615 RepID=L2GMZ8_VITCO|nr:60S ribosomal protein L7 [Vittaforma corneae ATCC 50505]ELA41677.1 60S ribosomal protein L7 [Vittaforma corneae ATCC 50505]